MYTESNPGEKQMMIFTERFERHHEEQTSQVNISCTPALTKMPSPIVITKFNGSPRRTC